QGERDSDRTAESTGHEPVTPVSHYSGGEPADIPPEIRTELAVARAVSAPYHRVERAETDQYGLPPAPAPLHECISAEDGHGAMGLHYINAAKLDADLDATLPEVLVYEPTGNDRLRLVALEYVVFEDAWKAEHGDTTPQLFGRDMTYVGDGNRYELPPFYQIHTWVWKNNPDGMFADHNPRVTCAEADTEH
ncbi:MAG: hypothetical protein ACRD0W_07240, partial [Acidimicrobiales bacterium]